MLLSVIANNLFELHPRITIVPLFIFNFKYYFDNEFVNNKHFVFECARTLNVPNMAFTEDERNATFVENACCMKQHKFPNPLLETLMQPVY